MKKMDLEGLLLQNSYPGRGIVLGQSEDGNKAIIVYFIMGRSENSRNRIFTEKNGGIITEAFDPQKLKDPSLIIYAPVRVLGDCTIVTNGDQTDTIVEHLQKDGGFESALKTRTFEPDSPNFTPRISGMVKRRDEGKMRYKLSIIKSNAGSSQSVQRFFFEYPEPVAGEGHLLHTYVTNGNPIPSFEGEPVRVSLSGCIDELTSTIWENLNSENKVSLFVRYIDIVSGEAETRIVNKNV